MLKGRIRLRDLQVKSCSRYCYLKSLYYSIMPTLFGSLKKISVQYEAACYRSMRGRCKPFGDVLAKAIGATSRRARVSRYSKTQNLADQVSAMIEHSLVPPRGKFDESIWSDLKPKSKCNILFF